MSEHGDNKPAETSDSGTVSENARQYTPQRETEPSEGKRYTYADYCTWGEDLDNGPDYRETKKRYELIDGIPFVMESPTWRHQQISGELFRQLSNFLKGRPCKVFAAPLDVRLNADGADNTVVQPDILVVCDDSKLTGKHCKGAPDMAIEILSPGSIQQDRLRKLHTYEKAGIREYWIVNPESRQVDICILENGKYFLKVYGAADIAPVYVLEGCTIDLAEVFAE